MSDMKKQILISLPLLKERDELCPAFAPCFTAQRLFCQEMKRFSCIAKNVSVHMLCGSIFTVLPPRFS